MYMYHADEERVFATDSCLKVCLWKGGRTEYNRISFFGTFVSDVPAWVVILRMFVSLSDRGLQACGPDSHVAGQGEGEAPAGTVPDSSTLHDGPSAHLRQLCHFQQGEMNRIHCQGPGDLHRTLHGTSSVHEMRHEMYSFFWFCTEVAFTIS